MIDKVTCLEQLRPYMPWYGFTRLSVARAVIEREERNSPVKIIVAGGYTDKELRFAGRLIAKAKRARIITTCDGSTRGRYYKFVG